MNLNPSDLAIETIPDRRKGGQHVGLPKMTIKVTHKPTGITASCGCERSQMRNRNACLAMIEYGLAELGYETNQTCNECDLIGEKACSHHGAK